MKLERKNKNLKESLDIERRWHLQLARRVKQLEKENKTLKECNKSQSEVINNVFIPQKERLEEENKKLKENIVWYEKEEDRLRKENKELKETIKDHQFYEEKLEHRIIEFEELLHWD